MLTVPLNGEVVALDDFLSFEEDAFFFVGEVVALDDFLSFEEDAFFFVAEVVALDDFLSFEEDLFFFVADVFVFSFLSEEAAYIGDTLTKNISAKTMVNSALSFLLIPFSCAVVLLYKNALSIYQITCSPIPEHPLRRQETAALTLRCWPCQTSEAVLLINLLQLPQC